ncbi:MAG: hypothetical protein A2W31_11080 [Planctomycetes bacterium RBG_16_64_10]|nr:MAG: hypothetical protein A2W31_11080 [Planctomycetes bacterium RBG_16_64_10]
MPVEWYCRLMGAEMGPFTAAQLLEMARSHQLTPEDMVRRGADGEWMAGYRVRGLFDPQTWARTIPANVPPPAAVKDAQAEKQAEQSAAAGGVPVEEHWFYISQGTKYGPLTFDILQQRSRSGELRPTDRVWSSSTPKWSQARQVKGLHFEVP